MVIMKQIFDFLLLTNYPQTCITVCRLSIVKVCMGKGMERSMLVLGGS